MSLDLIGEGDDEADYYGSYGASYHRKNGSSTIDEEAWDSVLELGGKECNAT